MESRCSVARLDVVTLSNDFVVMERKSCFQVTLRTSQFGRSRQEAEFFAALDGLGAAGGAELVKDSGTVCFDRIFRNE